MFNKTINIVKTKIKTPYGIILKVQKYSLKMHYLIVTQYKIKPVCSICGDDIDCWCCSTYEEALKGLNETHWCCEKRTCFYEKCKDDPLFIEKLNINNGNVDKAIDDIIDDYSEIDFDNDDEGLCEIMDEMED